MGDRVELMKKKKEDLKEAYGSMSKEARDEHFGVDPSFKFHHMRTRIEGGTDNLTEEDQADIEHDIDLAHTLQKQYLTQQELARQEAHGEDDLVVDFDPESDFGLHDSIRETTNRRYGQDTMGDIWDHQKEVAGSKDPIPLGADGTTHLTVVTETEPGVVFETQPGATTGFSEGWPEEKQPESPKDESPKEEKQPESPKKELTPQEQAALERDPDVDFDLDEDAYEDVDEGIEPMPIPEEGWSNEPQHTGIAHIVESYHPERPPVEDVWYGQAVAEEPDEIHEPEYRALPDQFYNPSVISQLQLQNRLSWGWNLTQYPRRIKKKLRRRKVKRNV